MHDVNLGGVDLNLLVALRALLAERHVTRAAARVGLSQPAMSHALARLRELLGDPLLVRTPSGMQLTPRADALAAPLERTLEDVARIVARPAAFDPRRSTHRFRLATSDYVELVLLPQLLARLWEEAPGIDVRVKNLVGRGVEEIADGRVDVVLGVFGRTPAPRGLFVQRLWRERFVCVVRADHPKVDKRLDLDDFLALPHALVAPRGESGGIVDSALARIGKRRRVAVEIPHFLVAPYLVRETDVVLTLAERVARIVAEPLGLRQLAPPKELAMEGFEVSLAYHERNKADGAHAWFRALVADVARSL